MKEAARKILPVLPAILVYALMAYKLDFIQDDAYISYRYVANLLNGHGLVFNLGERIEGFTNFGWVIYLAAWGAVTGGYILVSKVTGLVFGGAVIVLTYLIAQMLFSPGNRWFALLPAYLVGMNQSLAYWSPAGLETAVFAFLTMLSLLLFLRRSYWLIFAFVLAVWIRPEGALVAGLLIVIEAILERKLPVFSLRCAAVALVLSLPFVGFKLLYYGSVFPNPFYAKTGLHLDQLVSGLEYAGRFFADYAFYGIGFVIPLVFFRRLSREHRAVWLFSTLYVLYIVLVGGDVLKVHRFFIPIFGAAAILVSLSIRMLADRAVRKTRYLILFLAAVPLLALTYRLPLDYVQRYGYYEKLFVKKMRFQAQCLRESDSTSFSVAIPTIGVFGYELLGHDIIDMVGLTDSTIARHSEKPITGMETTWEEKKHNSRYLLTRAPDYIVFSTGVKPSAPAERALLLFPQFMQAYRTVGWFYSPTGNRNAGTIVSAFKRVRAITGDLVPTYPVEYVQEYKSGLDAYVAGNHAKAIQHYNKAISVSPKPYNPGLLYQKAFSHMMLNQHEKALRLLSRVLDQDSLVFEAHKDMYFYAVLMEKKDQADLHGRWLRKLVPWYFPKIKRDAIRIAAQARREIGS